MVVHKTSVPPKIPVKNSPQFIGSSIVCNRSELRGDTSLSPKK
jgi:hypothetical protein